MNYGGPRDSPESLARKAMLSIINKPTAAGELRPFLDPITIPTQRITSPPNLSNPTLSALRIGHYPEYAREFGPAPASRAAANIGTSAPTSPQGADSDDDEEEGDEAADEEEDDRDSSGEDEALAAKEALGGEDPPAHDRSHQVGYTSPFWALRDKAVRENNPNEEWKATECARNDEALAAFCEAVAMEASDEQLDEVKDATRLLYVLYGNTPYFYADADATACHPVQKEKICSLSPSLFLGETQVRGRHVPHLSALLVYMFSVPGTIRHAFEKAAEEGREIYYDELLGGLENDPILAKAIIEAGLYVVNPVGRCLIIGMSNSLGVGPRTDNYGSTIYPAGSKMGRVQAVTTHWPGAKYCLMHHGTTIGLSEIHVPGAAIYAAESVMIMATGSWRTTIEDVLEEIDGDLLEPRDPALSGMPVIGLNTTFFDKVGAFLRQPCLNVSGARQLIRKVADLTAIGPIKEYRDEHKDTAEMKVIEAWYRAEFKGIFAPTINMRVIYNFVRFRPAIMQRTLIADDMEADVARIVVERMPGKDPMAWKTRLSSR